MDGDMDGSHWGDNVLSSLCNGSYSDAFKTAEVNILRREDIGSRLIQGLVSMIPKSDNDKSAVTDILRLISKSAPVDDVIIEILDATACNENDDVFEISLCMFHILIARDFQKKELFIEWCLSSGRSYVIKADSFESSRKLKVYSLWIQFLEQVLDIVKSLNYDVRYTFTMYLLHFFTTNPSNELANHVVDVFLRTFSNPYSLLAVYKKRKQCHSKYTNPLYSKENTSDESFALFFYYLVTGGHAKVYSSQYLFNNMLPFVAMLVDSDCEMNHRKGIKLLEYLLSMSSSSLGMSDLNSSVRPTMERLNFIMVYEENKELRMASLHCFKALIDSYDSKAKYHLLLYFRKHVTHSGTLALLISYIKRIVEESLKCPGDNSQYYRGKRLIDLMRTYCYLTDGPKTNIVNDTEQILASLNFLRYLFAVKDHILPEIEGLIPELKLSFFEPLTTLISDTLMHCKQTLSDINSIDGSKISITNLEMPDLSVDDKIKSVLCSRNAAELIEITLNRVIEVIGVVL